MDLKQKVETKVAQALSFMEPEVTQEKVEQIARDKIEMMVNEQAEKVHQALLEGREKTFKAEIQKQEALIDDIITKANQLQSEVSAVDYEYPPQLEISQDFLTNFAALMLQADLQNISL